MKKYRITSQAIQRTFLKLEGQLKRMEEMKPDLYPNRYSEDYNTWQDIRAAIAPISDAAYGLHLEMMRTPTLLEPLTEEQS